MILYEYFNISHWNRDIWNRRKNKFTISFKGMLCAKETTECEGFFRIIAKKWAMSCEMGCYFVEWSFWMVSSEIINVFWIENS